MVYKGFGTTHSLRHPLSLGTYPYRGEGGATAHENMLRTYPHSQ